MAHVWISHDTHMNARSWPKDTMTPHPYYFIWIYHGTHMHEFWRTFEWVMARESVTGLDFNSKRSWDHITLFCPTPNMNESWHTHEWNVFTEYITTPYYSILLHIWMSHGTHGWEVFISQVMTPYYSTLFHIIFLDFTTYEWVMAHTWMGGLDLIFYDSALFHIISHYFTLLHIDESLHTHEW